jgi:hypothetical protein
MREPLIVDHQIGVVRVASSTSEPQIHRHAARTVGDQVARQMLVGERVL